MSKSLVIYPSFCEMDTPFGPVAAIWSVHQGQPKIVRIVLSKPGTPADKQADALYSDSIALSCPEIDSVMDHIASFLGGDVIRFPLDIVRMDLCSAFQQRVLRAEHGIPRGKVSTYQRIARHLGDAKVARSVGTALANNPFPIIIPCHRAIRTDLTLGGYQGGLEMKRTLLEMEGVKFNSQGRVVMGELFY
jgi:methylated-DNA-[protein]-cysteine S-methyltransferase